MNTILLTLQNTILISGQFTESFGSRKYLAVQMSTDEVNHLRATIDQLKNELHEERTRVDALKACLEQEREKYNKLTTSMDQNQPQSIQLVNGNKITVVVFLRLGTVLTNFGQNFRK